MDMGIWIDLIPREIIECIIYLLDNDSLDNLIFVYSNLKDVLNWSAIFSYRFDKYKEMKYEEYYRFISIEKLISIFGLEYNNEELNSLRLLNLSDKRITSIPKEIGLLVNLRQLYLSANKIGVIPKEIGFLVKLEVLYLFDNKITSIPKEIGLLVNLHGLYLHSNQIEIIPKEIGLLDNLLILDLKNNPIFEIPKEVSSLKNLHIVLDHY